MIVKLEGDVRTHIRTEQQLKLYIETLNIQWEAQINEQARLLSAQLQSKDSQLRALQKQNVSLKSQLLAKQEELACQVERFQAKVSQLEEQINSLLLNSQTSALSCHCCTGKHQ